MPKTFKDRSGNNPTPFSMRGTQVSFAATDGVAITPSDTAILADITRGIYVGGTGAVVVEFVSGRTATFPAVPVGTILPIQAVRVLSTGTTATNLVALL